MKTYELIGGEVGKYINNEMDLDVKKGSGSIYFKNKMGKKSKIDWVEFDKKGNLILKVFK